MVENSVSQNTVNTSNNKPVKAIVGNRAILCGKCGHKIAGCREFRPESGNGKIYLLCKHKDKGKKCFTENVVCL
jgi:hypothetical protein